MASLRLISVSRERLADRLTPVTVLQTLAPPGQAPGALLESVEGGERWGRHSLVLCDPLITLRADAEGLCVRHEDGHLERFPGAPLAQVQAVLAEFFAGSVQGSVQESGAPEQASPVAPGSAVGALGYDLARTFEPEVFARSLAPPPLDPSLPLLSLFVPGTQVVFDNLRKVLRLTCSVVCDAGQDLAAARARATRKLDALEARLSKPAAGVLLQAPEAGGVSGQAGFTSRTDDAAYEAAVAEVRERILAGECIQVVLARCFEARATEQRLVPPFEVYRQLRVLNPSPYLYYLNLPPGPGAPEGEPTLEIAGSSPEVLVRREGDRATVRPIAGTRPRGATPEADLALEAELAADPKERAEHVMLVDLGRNDLGRVARAGTVRVVQREKVERYSHVMHLVSEVQAQLRPDVDLAGLVAATFPAGTLSGAPKVRAMQIIDTLEPHGRGLYGGAVGLLAPGGRMDLAICIRTLVQAGGRQWIGAGAGIVADSVPAREREETVHKASALFRAVAAARAALSQAKDGAKDGGGGAR